MPCHTYSLSYTTSLRIKRDEIPKKKSFKFVFGHVPSIISQAMEEEYSHEIFFCSQNSTKITVFGSCYKFHKS